MPLHVSHRLLSQEPLGVPKINPDESSSSSGEEPEPPIPRRSRRASSITRAGNAALSLSNNPNIAVTSLPLIATPAESSLNNKPDEGNVRQVTVNHMEKSVRRLFAAAPAYPGGVGGCLIAASSSPIATLSPLGGSDDTTTKRKTYRMVFDGKEQSHRGGTGLGLAELAELPLGLEAVPDESDPALLCVRELSAGGNSAAGGGVSSVDGSGAAGSLVARIKARRTAAGSRECFYSVELEPGKGGRAGAELMAVRISTHPTRLAAPREVQAVLLLPPRGKDAEGKQHAQENGGWVTSACLLRYTPMYICFEGIQTSIDSQK